ncbi:MAG: adenylosuccinate synthase, partial [Planctomycetes bacterium HGW-Planctomycetes-2]
MVGLQWGDEGKGKVIDLLASRFDAVVRYNGGANAGHSVVIGGRRHALHLLPSGVFHKGVLSVIGNGVVVDPEALLREIDALRDAGVDPLNLALSDRAHVVMPYHKQEDAIRESLLAGEGEDRSIGTTKRGIGPAYADKAHRSAAIRIGDLLRPDLLAERLTRACALKARMLAGLSAEPLALDPAAMLAVCLEQGRRLAPYITDTTHLLHGILTRGGSLLFEGANATLLDLDHGAFPFVTSSNCSVLGVPAGSGVPGRSITTVIGVLKAYSTRVGAGPFPTELADATGDRIRERGREYGTTTGRPRRCGWL